MKKEFWVATVFIVFIAAWLRFYDLANYHGGLLLDEIWMALNARNLGEGVTVCCPLYFSLPFGGHPLFVYLSWLAQLFFAPPFAGRTLSATLGTLSVLSLIFVLYSLSRSKLLALVGGFTLATTVSHITFSRAGLETLLPSVIAIPLIWLIYQTYEKGSWRYAILCGIVLGLSFYSYAPAAAFPIAVLAFAVWRHFTFTHHASRITNIKLTSILLLISFLCILPFLYTLFFTPNQYLSHLLGTTQATRSGNIFLSLIENTLRVIGGVSLEGQVTQEHNFQGQPLFNPVVSLFFWIGLLISIIGAWRKQPVPQLMIVWAVSTSLPTLLSDHAPNFARWLQALPALVFFVGTGVMWVVELIVKCPFDKLRAQPERSARHTERNEVKSKYRAQSKDAMELQASPSTNVFLVAFGTSLKVLTPVFVIALGGFTFYQSTATYFSVPLDKRDQMWGAPHRVNAEKMIQYSKDSLVFASPMNVPLIQPVFDLLLRDTEVNQIDGRSCLPLAWNQNRPTIYSAVTLADKVTMDRLPKLYPSGRIVNEVLDYPNLYPYSQFYEVPPNTKPNLTLTSTQTSFAGGVGLIGYDMPSAASPNDRLTVNLYWRLDDRLRDELLVFVHFGRVGDLQPLAQHDGSPCDKGLPTPRWVANVVYPDSHSIQLPNDLKADIYEIRVGIYRWPSQERLDVTQSEKKVLEKTILVLGTVEVK